jgi:hypothetical protein
MSARFLARFRTRQPEPGSVVADSEAVRGRLAGFQLRLLECSDVALQNFGGDGADVARFARNDLLASRVHAASHFLNDLSEDNAEHLGTFLSSVEKETCTHIGAAESAEEIAEMLIQGAEDLHSYLLAHDIVDARYRHLTAGSLFRRPSGSHGPTSRASWEQERLASAAAAVDSHEYALAA